MDLHVLGIRHHGPGSARSVKEALESLQPARVEDDAAVQESVSRTTIYRRFANRDFDVVRTEYVAAWRDKESLDAHDRHLVRLGMAVVNGNRPEARKVGFEMERLWPGDPDLDRIRKEFGEDVPQGRPLRPRWRKP